MDDKKNKIIVGAVIAVVILVVVILVTIDFGSSCELVEKKPEPLDAALIKNMASSDQKALVNFDGYLEYFLDEKETKKYMPLNLKSVEQDLVDVKGESSRLKLKLLADCATLSLTLNNLQGGRTSMEYFDINLKLPNNKLDSCEITSQLSQFDVPSDKHYKCSIPKEFTCQTAGADKKTIVKLVLNKFEFEVNGNPENIKKNEFGRQAQICK